LKILFVGGGRGVFGVHYFWIFVGYAHEEEHKSDGKIRLNTLKYALFRANFIPKVTVSFAVIIFEPLFSARARETVTPFTPFLRVWKKWLITSTFRFF
jgi:hypothetical protein